MGNPMNLEENYDFVEMHVKPVFRQALRRFQEKIRTKEFYMTITMEGDEYVHIRYSAATSAVENYVDNMISVSLLRSVQDIDLFADNMTKNSCQRIYAC